MLKPADNQSEIARTLYRYDKLAPHRIKYPEALTEDNVKQYYELGYVAIEEVLTKEELAQATSELSDVIQGRIVGPKVQYVKNREITEKIDLTNLSEDEREFSVRKLQHFVDYCPSLKHISDHPEIMAVLERLFGEAPQLRGDQAILKPTSKEAGVEKPWHQDMAYRNFSYTKMVAGVWVALDDATLAACISSRGPIATGRRHLPVRWDRCTISFGYNNICGIAKLGNGLPASR